jgi:hypothetical protein
VNCNIAARLANSDTAPKGVLGGIGALNGTVIEDAFSNFLYDDDRSGELFLVDGFAGGAAAVPIADPSISLPAPLVRHDRPEWIFLHEDGLTISVRRTPSTLPVPP